MTRTRLSRLSTHALLSTVLALAVVGCAEKPPRDEPLRLSGHGAVETEN